MFDKRCIWEGNNEQLLFFLVFAKLRKFSRKLGGTRLGY